MGVFKHNVAAFYSSLCLWWSVNVFTWLFFHLEGRTTVHEELHRMTAWKIQKHVCMLLCKTQICQVRRCISISRHRNNKKNISNESINSKTQRCYILPQNTNDRSSDPVLSPFYVKMLKPCDKRFNKKLLFFPFSSGLQPFPPTPTREVWFTNSSQD